MEVLAGLVALLLMLATFSVLLFGSTVVYGITLHVLWGWFIVPVFHAPALGIAQAIGLSLVVGYLTQQHPVEAKTVVEPKTEEEKKAAQVKAVVGLFSPLTRALSVLIFGWLLHTLFM